MLQSRPLLDMQMQYPSVSRLGKKVVCPQLYVFNPWLAWSLHRSICHPGFDLSLEAYPASEIPINTVVPCLGPDSCMGMSAKAHGRSLCVCVCVLKQDGESSRWLFHHAHSVGEDAQHCQLVSGCLCHMHGCTYTTLTSALECHWL